MSIATSNVLRMLCGGSQHQKISESRCISRHSASLYYICMWVCLAASAYILFYSQCILWPMGEFSRASSKRIAKTLSTPCFEVSTTSQGMQNIAQALGEYKKPCAHQHTMSRTAQRIEATTLRQNVSSINDPIVSFARRNLFIFYWFAEVSRWCCVNGADTVVSLALGSAQWFSCAAYWVCTRHTLVCTSIGSVVGSAQDNKIRKWSRVTTIASAYVHLSLCAYDGAQVQWTRNVAVVSVRLRVFSSRTNFN